MMSSYNGKISAKNVRISEHSKAVNDKIFIEEEKFEEKFIEEKQKSITEKIKELEERMIKELEEKRESMIQQGYEEGKRIAVHEAEQNVKESLKNIIEQANLIYNEANNYKKQVLEDIEHLREKTLRDEKDNIVHLSCEIASMIVKTKLSPNEFNLDGIYEEMAKQIQYDTKKIYIKVHPALREWVEKSDYINQDNRIVFIYDINLNVGDLFVETDKEYIDASVDEKIKEIEMKIRSVVHDSI